MSNKFFAAAGPAPVPPAALVVGLLIWAAALAFLPAPPAARILLLDTRIRTQRALDATAVLLGVAAYRPDSA